MENVSSLDELVRGPDAARLSAAPAQDLGPQPWGERAAKRTVDVVVSCSALFFLLPLLLLVAAMVCLSSRGPAMISHKRVGRHGTPFGCLKFRTMQRDADAVLQHHLAKDPDARLEWEQTHKLRRDPRVTPLGSVLRKTSVDELPQFINVLKGDMSLVGPRPIVDGEKVRYGRHFHDYCRVKPGITGLWQISGRSDVTYRRRVLFDKYYVRKQSFWLDALIVLKTIPAVLKTRGSY